MKTRYDWVDCLKFWGILAIYIGHFGSNAGKLYEFVFLYHVPLFFFSAGFFTRKNTGGGYILDKAKRLIIPYIVLGFINIIFFGVHYSYGIRQTLKMFLSFGGRRSDMDWFGSMWFLPCLFIVIVLYEILFKLLRTKILVLIASVFIHIGAVYVLIPTLSRHMLFSVDCALMYLVYYCLGSILFPYIQKMEYAKMNGKQRIFMLGSTAVVLGVVLLAYFQKHLLVLGLLQWTKLHNVILAMILILANVILAKCFPVKWMSELGKHTLTFCGIEDCIKRGLMMMGTALGLQIAITQPWQVIAYSILCLLIAGKYICVPIEKFIDRIS